MDPSSFDQTLAKLDQELRARREGLEKRKKAEQDLAQVRIQQQAVKERMRAAEEIGAPDLRDQVAQLLVGLAEEEKRLLTLITPAPAPAPVPAGPSPVPAAPLPAPVPAPVPAPAPAHAPAPVPVPVSRDPLPVPVPARPSPSDVTGRLISPSAETKPLPRPPEEDPSSVREAKYAAEALVQEVEEILPSLPAEPTDLRNTRFNIWSFRWRLLRERAERELPSAMGILSWAYAQLMEARKSVPDVPFLRAFNPKEKGDWPKELADAETLLSKLRLKFRPPRTRAVEVHARRKEEETKAIKRDEEAYEHLNRLKAVPVNFCLPEDPDGVRAFREAARGCLKFAKRLGHDLRSACGPYRDLLEGEEWEPIWTVEDKPSSTPQDRARSSTDAQDARRTWTRRDLIGRMLRRMLAKKEIGGKHTEIHNLYQGLPDHVRGDAKEGVELLVKEGVLRRKPTTKDEHVSIEPSFVRVVEDLLEGRPLPPNIGKWLDETPVIR